MARFSIRPSSLLISLKIIGSFILRFDPNTVVIRSIVQVRINSMVGILILFRTI